MDEKKDNVMSLRLSEADKEKLKTISEMHVKSMSEMLLTLMRYEYDRLSELGYIDK